MRFAISIPQFVSDGQFDPARFRAYMARAEAFGFESAWTLEQTLGTMPFMSPLQTMSYAAACTERIRLGCVVFVTPLHSPVHLTKDLSSLDQLSRGRIEIGVGTGGRHRMFSAFQVDPTSLVARFNEGLRLMKALWTEPRVNFDGRFWQLKDAGMEPKPFQKPHPPIWFGASHPDAASGQIDAEPFHHTRGRGARLRPECAAELAQAHADLLRQTLDGEPFGDVIASIANGSGNPVILWRQIEGSCELRLSAMAAMVDDEVLCHAFGDGKTMVLLDQSQREIDPGRDARRSPYVAVPTEDAICLNPDGWVLSLKARCISPMRRRSTPVQQSSRREGECTGADAHNAPASARCLHNTAQRASG